jgi:sugar-specific transcriptional regulator TrmB
VSVNLTLANREFYFIYHEQQNKVGDCNLNRDEEILTRLGLSYVQANAFICLVEAGTCRASFLAKRSGIARPDIYRIMSIFEKIGLINKSLTSPTTYTANPIAQIIPILFNKKLKETQELEKDTRELIDNLSKHQKVEKEPKLEPIMYMVPATEIAIIKRKEFLNKTKNSVEGVMSWKYYNSLFTDGFKKLIKQVIEKGIKYRLIIEIPENIEFNPNQNAIVKGLEIRSINYAPKAIVSIYDRENVYISMSNLHEPAKAQHLWSNNESIVELTSLYFERLWEKAKKIL